MSEVDFNQIRHIGVTFILKSAEQATLMYLQIHLHEPLYPNFWISRIRSDKLSYLVPIHVTFDNESNVVKVFRGQEKLSQTSCYLMRDIIGLCIRLGPVEVFLFLHN